MAITLKMKIYELCLNISKMNGMLAKTPDASVSRLFLPNL